MKKVLLKITALMLCVVLLCSGCSVGDIFNYLFFGYYPDTAFSEMTYQRPDLTALETALNDCTEYAKEAKDLDTLVNKIAVFFRLFSNFHTQYMLSYIHYCHDMSDSYWEKEYNYCEERTAQAEGARDQLMHALADCPFREELETEEYLGEGCFEDYQGESIWTEEFKALVQEESRLEAQYYELSSQAMESGFGEEFQETYGVQLEELYVSLVKLRGQIASEAGYESYPDYAYDLQYNRDFTPEQAIAYCNDIRQELVPLYRELFTSGSWNGEISGATHWQTFGYVEGMANKMGGQILEAFEKMKDNELYHIAPGENKYEGSFETYLYDYEEPYVFVGPTQSVRDHLSFAHEFGHFCNDYVSGGSEAGIDVAEIFSQGMEYLSLCYADASEELVRLKMEDSLFVYVEQAAYACFEQQVYGLPSEEVTVENIRKLFERTGNAFGFDTWEFDSQMYVVIAHFFVQPMYVISYVVSNDVAMQLYQLEEKEERAGLRVYRDTLDTQQEGMMGYLEEAKLENPFQPGRIEKVAKTLRNIIFLE